MQQDIFKFKHDVIKVLDACKILTLNIIKVKVKRLQEKEINFLDIDDIKYLKYLQSYLEFLIERIIKSDNFVELLYKTITTELNNIAKRQCKYNNYGICEICKTYQASEMHHIIPITYGGNDKEYNLAALCRDCHKLEPYEYIIGVLSKCINT